MILAALTVLTIGVADLVRLFAPRRWRWPLLAVLGGVILVVGALAAAILPAVAAVVLAGGWVWLLPRGRRARAGAWPAIGVAIVCAAAMATVGVPGSGGVIGAVWHLPTPMGELSFPRTLLVLGVACFLLESANIVVRLALTGPSAGVSSAAGEADAAASANTAPADEPAAGSPDAEDAPAAPLPAPPALKGGRLIGPLERLLTLALTLAGAYPLLAALVAAKGIVRFPEISRDGSTGNRAEYFLVGSMVSWTQALAAALLVWWSTAAV